MSSDQEWANYKAKFNKIYQDAQEEQMRRELYSKVRQRVDENNKYYEANKFLYSEDVNTYSDHTPEELANVDWDALKDFQISVEDET